MVYRHNDKMIDRLERAGLGFFVKDADSHQKLGKTMFLVIVVYY